jgi:hypothetical protein
MKVNFVVHFLTNDFSRSEVKKICNRLDNYYDGYEFTIGGLEWTQRLYYYNVDKNLLSEEFRIGLQRRGIAYKILNKTTYNYNFD